VETVPMTVVETPFFVRKAAGLLTDQERDELIIFLGLTPEAGDVIPDSGGIRKVRWRAKGKGKRGGVRVIYYFHNDALPLFLLTVYAKSQKANLTQAERNEWKELVPILIRTYERGRPR
jgi:mRNA-degrading endonuclease RelE of RelBE toxin-antitoxin system